MKQKIKINNSYDCATIDIEGTIGVPEQWQFDDPQQRVATYEAFRKTLQQIEELQTPRVVVNIRSTGGDVADALLIYEALTSLDAEITTRCWGYVASAATVIAQAASEGLRELSPNTLYLVHSSTCSAEGNAQELQQRVELLKKSDERLAELYARRSGRDVESIAALMSEEGGSGRWLNAEETIAAGFADCLIEGVVAATTEEDGATQQTMSERVAEGVESALRSVKGLIHKIGVQLSGEQSVEAEQEQLQEQLQEQEQEQPQEPESEQKPQKMSLKERKSKIEFEQEQEQMRATPTTPVDDPSLRDAVINPNERAYQDDSRRLMRSRL